MTEFGADHGAVGIDDIKSPAAWAPAAKGEGCVGEPKPRRLGDFPSTLRQTLLERVDPMLDAVESLYDLLLEITARPPLHVGADDAVAPRMKGGTEIFGIGQTDLPMCPGSAAAPFLRPNQETIGFSDSFGNIRNEIRGLR